MKDEFNDEELLEQWNAATAVGDDADNSGDGDIVDNDNDSIDNPGTIGVSSEDVPADAGKLEPPGSWKASAKEKFSSLPEEIQHEVLRRESDFHRGIDDYRATNEWAKQFEPIQDVVMSLRERFGSEVEGVKTLFKLDEFANADPMGFIIEFARSKNIDLSGTSAARPDSVYNEIRDIKNQLEQSRMSEHARLEVDARAQLDAFINEKRPYFEDVRSEMSRLIGSGIASDLGSAYEHAVWANPEIRSKMIAESNSKKISDAKSAKKSASINVKSDPENIDHKQSLDSIVKSEARRLGFI